MTDRGLMTRKSVAAIMKEAGEHTLDKTLGPLSIMALGIGCIIGAGIFVLTGMAARTMPAPVSCSPSSSADRLTFGRLCSPIATRCRSPAAPTPIPMVLGEILAWFSVGTHPRYAIASIVAVGWSGYIVSLLHNFGINIPPQYAAAPWTEFKQPDGSTVAGIVNLPAAFMVSCSRPC